MRLEFGPEADAAYLALLPRGEAVVAARTVPCCAGDADAAAINLDLDAEGHLVGIEILDARRTLPPQVLPPSRERSAADGSSYG